MIRGEMSCSMAQNGSVPVGRLSQYNSLYLMLVWPVSMPYKLNVKWFTQVIMLFNNLIFSPLAGHKLILRWAFGKSRLSVQCVHSSNRTPNDKPPVFGPLSHLCVMSLTLPPSRLCLTTYNYVFGVTRLELCPREKAIEKQKWHTCTEMFFMRL